MTGRRGSRRVLVAAGEVSGDRMAAGVVREILNKTNGLGFVGFGGAAMASAGVRLWEHESALAVTGAGEALSRAGRVAALLWRVRRQLRADPPRLGLLVDYPGLNLRIAAMLRRAKVPVLYYGAPQRWAWLGFRAGALSRKIDRLAVTLPFEEPWFRARGIDATFVGHPAVERFCPLDRGHARQQLGLGRGPVLALLPGSRDNEIRRHLPPLVDAVRMLRGRFAPLLAVVPGAGARLCADLAPGLRQTDARLALSAADVALCASGTVTLEAALANVPMAVFYRLSPTSHALARALVRVPYIALPNLLLNRPLVPELIQNDMTPRNLARQAERLLRPETAGPMRAGLTEVVDRLGPPGAASKVAAMAIKLIENKR